MMIDNLNYKSKNFSANHGFTIIELSVVLLLMAILTAIVMPNFINSYARKNLDIAAYQLQQEIRTLGQQALQKESANYRIVFNLTNEYYVIYGPNGTLKVTMPKGIDIVDTNFDDPQHYIYDRIVFSARGIPTNGGHIAIKSTVTGDFKYIIVALITGRTRVSDSPPVSVNDNL